VNHGLGDETLPETRSVRSSKKKFESALSVDPSMEILHRELGSDRLGRRWIFWYLVS
jgi:hypothetical protein